MFKRITLALLAGALLSLLLVATPASAQQPYGGCKEARLYSQSDGAAWCRAHGWIVRPRALVGPVGHIYYMDLRPCHYEDGSRPGDRQQRHCFWNAGTMGNRRGHSFILDQTRARIVVTYLGSRQHRGWAQYITAGSVR